MLGALLLVALIVVAGSGASDRLCLRQEEHILHRLPINEAHAYYETLVRRATKKKILRAVTLLCLFILLWVWRKTR